MIFTLLLLHEPMILLCGIAKKFNLSHAFSPQWVLRAINHIVRDKSQAARDTNQDAHNATHVATETWRHAAVYSLFCGAFFLKFPLSKIWSLLSFSSEGNITKLSCYNNALNPLSLKTEPVKCTASDLFHDFWGHPAGCPHKCLAHLWPRPVAEVTNDRTYTKVCQHKLKLKI